ncbi:helix-turn-helix domain-containing protein [Vagococcus sp. BWB3-3]|uniref:Helix-turn-helix domain-containing protein n=1 Tax=Vagococcus allomyrinae TaxID=2794353 RepID=A0A940PB27_9ENTE|nr:helix-turn-helix domain-containing protein [Vagococcus allomyrinae]MBP1039413.1 helix-turn-helix domain-containing protein [Vagococcus allomyrinae]
MLLSFLKKNEITKLKLLSIFFANDKVIAKELEALLQTPPTTTSRMLVTLKDDLQQLFDGQILIKEKNQFFFLEKEDDISQAITTNKLYYSYLVKSIEYQIFRAIIFENHVNMLSLCAQINISQSYCYSRIKKINDYLAPFKLKIVSENFIISITGPETHRIFFTCQIRDLIRNLEQHPRNNPQKQSAALNDRFHFDHIDKIPSVHLDVFHSFIETYEQRKNYLDAIIVKRKDIKDIYNLIIVENNVFDQTGSLETTKDDAVQFYNLFIRSLIPNIDTYDQRVRIGEALYRLKGNIIVDHAVQLTNEIINQIFSDVLARYDEQYFELIYLISLYGAYMDIFGIDFKSRVKQSIHLELIGFGPHVPAPLETRIRALVTASSQVYPSWKEETKEDYVQLVTKVLYSLVYSYQQPTYNIMIDTFSYLIGEYSIQKQILNYFSTSHINFVDDYSKVDLLITDRFISYGNKTPVFFFSDIHSIASWEKLLTMIVQQTHRKLVRQVNLDGKQFKLA